MKPASKPPTDDAASRGRALRFEAKKFALETLVKIYIEQSNGSRALVVSQARVMLTLAIAAMAGFVTIVAAILRGDPSTARVISPLAVGMGLLGVALLVASALWATKALSRATRMATNLLRDPFPTAKRELVEMFGAQNEDIVLDNLLATVQLHIADSLPSNNFGAYATMSLIFGIALASGSLVVPLVIRGA